MVADPVLIGVGQPTIRTTVVPSPGGRADLGGFMTFASSLLSNDRGRSKEPHCLGREEMDMQIMGTNRWDRDVDSQRLVTEALKFADAVKAQGIAELRGAWIAEDDKLMWCSWDAQDVTALQAAFDEMNRRSGLTSELTVVKTFFSPIQATTAVSPV